VVGRRVVTPRGLSARLERGELTRRDADAVGRALAGLHEREPLAAPAGLPALAIERRLTESFHEVLAVVEQRGEIERVLALERFAHAFVVTRAQTLNVRARRGRTRQLHGNLRAEHVLFVSGGVQFVGVESDHATRELDVADDLACLVMDLVARGGARYARSLVRGYRHAGGDPGDDALIAFYAAYRALLLAKVEVVRAAERPATSAAHGHHSARARDLLSLAERFAWQARMPLVIVVCGVAASGKTRLAEAVSSLSQLAHLSADLTRRRLEPALDHLAMADLDLLAYAELGRRAAQHVAARGGAIADGGFCRREARDAFVSALACAAPTLFVECGAPAAVRARRGAVDSERWEPLDEIAPHAHLTLRADRPVEELTDDILALLDQRIGQLRR